jgi:hypothetical protein
MHGNGPGHCIVVLDVLQRPSSVATLFGLSSRPGQARNCKSTAFPSAMIWTWLFDPRSSIVDFACSWIEEVSWIAARHTLTMLRSSVHA